MTATSTLATWAQVAPSDVSPAASVITALGEYAADYDIDGLTRAYLDAIDATLPDGLSLAASGEVYGPHDYPGDADTDLTAAIEAVDFWALAADYDRATQD